MFLPIILPAQITGQVDMTFGQQGIQSLYHVEGTKNGLLLTTLSQGGFYTAQAIGQPGSQVTQIQRFLSDGVLDLSYGQGGKRNVQLEGAVLKIMALPDSSLAMCGYAQRTRNRDLWVMRLLPDGQTDLSFGIQGVVTLRVAGHDEASTMSLLPSGDMLLAGTTSKYSAHTDVDYDLFVVKINRKGQLDASFGNKGVVIHDFSPEDRLKDMLVDPDGKILIAANTRPERLSLFSVLRLLPNGRLDASFGMDGISTVATGLDQSYVEGMILQADQSILLGGHAKMNTLDLGFDIVVLRLLPDGQWDKAYGKHGVSVHDLSGIDYFGGMILQQDGLLLVGAMSGTSAHVFRIQKNGDLDLSYGRMGHTVLPCSSRLMSIHLALDPGENLLLSVAEHRRSYLRRLWGNPQLPGLETVLQFDWKKEEQETISYTGITLAEDIHLDAWVGGPLLPSDSSLLVSGVKSAQPIAKYITFFAHLSLDESHRFTFVWDSEGQAHWYWNGSFRNTWSVLR